MLMYVFFEINESCKNSSFCYFLSRNHPVELKVEDSDMTIS